MTGCRLVLATAAADAGVRIGAAREAHLARLRPLAASGEVFLALPLMDAAGAWRGSLVLVAEGAADRYLDAEPFRREGIWAGHETHPFRLAPLPYRALPDGPVPAAPTHTVAIAWDGTDPGAETRRLAARGAHLARVLPEAEAGILTLGGAILDAPDGRMVGSVAVTAHPSLRTAQEWWAEDPYLRGGVWRDVAWHLTRFAPLSYRPLPGGA